MTDLAQKNIDITVSIVSHEQSALVTLLLEDLLLCEQVKTIIITYNKPENMVTIPYGNKYEIRNIFNDYPKGYGANHNAAFKLCDTQYFCVLNPDIRLPENPFPILIDYIFKHSLSMVAPFVYNTNGVVEDSFRRFPSPMLLFLRQIGITIGDYSLRKNTDIFYPDWIAGMFMLFKSIEFNEICGFDEKFFLYCEDIDICVRLLKENKKYSIVNASKVIHIARHGSHNNIKYLLWHIKSFFLLWFKHLGRYPK